MTGSLSLAATPHTQIRLKLVAPGEGHGDNRLPPVDHIGAIGADFLLLGRSFPAVIAFGALGDAPFGRLPLAPPCFRTARRSAAATMPRRARFRIGEVANPIAQPGFDRVEPVVEKIARLFQLLAALAKRSCYCVSSRDLGRPALLTPESLVGRSWRLRRLQFSTTPATAPGSH